MKSRLSACVASLCVAWLPHEKWNFRRLFMLKRGHFRVEADRENHSLDSKVVSRHGSLARSDSSAVDAACLKWVHRAASELELELCLPSIVDFACCVFDEVDFETITAMSFVKWLLMI